MRKLLSCLVVLAALPSSAGVTYTAVTRTILGSKTHAGDVRVRAWVEGKQARIEFLESSVPEMETGTYLISKDGGETSYLVDPRSKSYERWDMSAMIGNMADIMRSMRSQMKVRFEEPTVEKLVDELGPQIDGLPTHHYRYRSSYVSHIEMAETETISTVTEEDIWTTTAITDPGVIALLNKRPSSGDEQLDRMIQKEMNKVSGFPLKRITSMRTETKKETSESRTEMEIVEVKTLPIAAGMFQIPKGYMELDPHASDLDNALKKLEKQHQHQPED